MNSKIDDNLKELNKYVYSNSSPLIYLSKIGRVDLLRKLFEKVIIPQEVYEEVVVRGKEERFPDALVIENAVKEKWIIVKDLENGEAEYLRDIDIGEEAVIKMARKNKANLVLLDDASANAIAKSLGLNVRGTLYVLLLACKKELISKDMAKTSIKDLIKSGFRISAKVYAEIMDELEKIE